MINVVLHPIAQAEADATYTWYAAQSQRLADRFAEAIADARAMLAQMPGIGAECDRTHRRYPLKKFPHGLIYRQEGDTVLIVAVGHKNQRPGFWAGRA